MLARDTGPHSRSAASGCGNLSQYASPAENGTLLFDFDNDWHGTMTQATVALRDRDTTESRRNQTSRRILQVSAQLFIEHGFDRVSVEDIIAATGIARSSFYRLFANRKDVLARIVRPVFERGTQLLKRPHDANARTAMDHIFSTYLTLWQDNSQALKVSMRVGGSYFELFRDAHQAYREQIMVLLNQAEAAGILLNGSAERSARLIARTAIPCLEIHADLPDMKNHFFNSMRGLLLTVEEKQ